jgi:hypothetical protein
VLIVLIIVIAAWLASLGGYMYHSRTRERINQLERDMVETNEATSRYLGERIEALERGQAKK